MWGRGRKEERGGGGGLAEEGVEREREGIILGGGG